MNKLKSFQGDKKLKTMVLAEVENHRKQDQIMQGTYGRDYDGVWKGCAVGCTVKSINIKLNKDYSTSDHSIYEKVLGLPEWLARLEDSLFEKLPKEEAKKWPSAFLKAIPVGVNLESVKWKFCAYLLSENIKRVLGLKIEYALKEQVVSAIRQCLTLQEEAIKTGKWNESAAESAWSVAESAAANMRYSKYLLKLLKNAK